MSDLNKLPNIGKTLEKRLIDAGVLDSETLMLLGSREAFLRLRLLEGDTCYSTLCALEGAVKGIRWHELSPEDKEVLHNYYQSLAGQVAS